MQGMLTREKKARIAKQITDLLAKEYDADPILFSVVFVESLQESYARGGTLYADRADVKAFAKSPRSQV